MPTADSQAAAAAAKSKATTAVLGTNKGTAPVLTPPKTVVDPSAARYAALQAAAKSKPGAAAAIAKAQTEQAKASIPHGMANTLNNFEAQKQPPPKTNPKVIPKVIPNTVPGSFMNTPGYNSGNTPVTPTPITIPRQDFSVGGGDTGSGGGGSAAIPTTAVKVATPDIILVDQESLPVDLMTNLIFEDIGGQELLSLSRHDLITGSGLEYQPITNLNDIAIQYNSQNIIPMPDSSSSYLANFPISLDSYIIEQFSNIDSSHIKINSSRELEILLENLKFGEQIEVEVLSSISIYNSTKRF
jgi:hypothetical protein